MSFFFKGTTHTNTPPPHPEQRQAWSISSDDGQAGLGAAEGAAGGRVADGKPGFCGVRSQDACGGGAVAVVVLWWCNAADGLVWQCC